MHAELTSTQEDYLETMLRLVEEKRVARVKDIAARMHVHKSSVASALRTLSERGLVNYEPYELITLTPEGEEAAQRVADRHDAIEEFFRTVLHVDEATASEVACQMEHAVPEVVLERFGQFMEFLKTCPLAGNRLVEGFGFFCENGPDHGKCTRCAELAHRQALANEKSKSKGGARKAAG